MEHLQIMSNKHARITNQANPTNPTNQISLTSPISLIHLSLLMISALHLAKIVWKETVALAYLASQTYFCSSSSVTHIAQEELITKCRLINASFAISCCLDALNVGNQKAAENAILETDMFWTGKISVLVKECCYQMEKPLTTKIILPFRRYLDGLWW